MLVYQKNHNDIVGNMPFEEVGELTRKTQRAGI